MVEWLVGPNVFLHQSTRTRKNISTLKVWVQSGPKLISSKHFVPDIFSPGVIVCNNYLPKRMLYKPKRSLNGIETFGTVHRIQNIVLLL